MILSSPIPGDTVSTDTWMLLSEPPSLRSWYETQAEYWKHRALREPIEPRDPTTSSWDQLALETSEDYANFLFWAYDGDVLRGRGGSSCSDSSLAPHLHPRKETLDDIRRKYQKQKLDLETLKSNVRYLEERIERVHRIFEEKRQKQFRRRRW